MFITNINPNKVLCLSRWLVSIKLRKLCTIAYMLCAGSCGTFDFISGLGIKKSLETSNTDHNA